MAIIPILTTIPFSPQTTDTVDGAGPGCWRSYRALVGPSFSEKGIFKFLFLYSGNLGKIGEIEDLLCLKKQYLLLQSRYGTS